MSDKVESYDEKVLAFIDILGFSQLINKFKENNDKPAKILSILTRIKEFELESNESDDFKHILEFSVFSDSIVITCNPSKIHSLLWACGFFQAELLSLGVATRGDISLGRAHHKDGILFGEAMLEAYFLESKAAIYPRILVSEDAAKKLMPFVRNLKIFTDFDGLKYLDFFAHTGVPEKNGALNSISKESKVCALNLIRVNIEENIKNTENIIHRAKWEWIKRKYNDHVKSSPLTSELTTISI